MTSCAPTFSIASFRAGDKCHEHQANDQSYSLLQDCQNTASLPAGLSTFISLQLLQGYIFWPFPVKPRSWKGDASVVGLREHENKVFSQSLEDGVHLQKHEQHLVKNKIGLLGGQGWNSKMLVGLKNSYKCSTWDVRMDKRQRWTNYRLANYGLQQDCRQGCGLL